MFVLCIFLVLIYAIRFLVTPFFSFFSACNSLSFMSKVALTLIPFCCQELVFGAGAGKPIIRSILTFARLGHPAYLSSSRKSHFLEL